MVNNKKICVIGLGYIGLPTAALLANRGYDVHGVDVVQSTVDTINQGKIHIVEPELDTFVHAAVNSGKLKADLKPIEADVFIIAVPTPFHEGYVPNIDYVVSATKAIAPYVKDNDIIILGHTHEQMYIEKDNKIILNPGSLSITKQPKISFCLIEFNSTEFNVIFKNISYDVLNLKEVYYEKNIPGKEFLLSYFYPFLK